VGSTFFIGKLLNCNFAAHDWLYLCARLHDRFERITYVFFIHLQLCYLDRLTIFSP
jgi:hypothetical protein